MLKLNARVRDDILGELRIFIQSRFLLFRRRRHHRKTRSVCARFFCIAFFCVFLIIGKNKQTDKQVIRIIRLRL